MAEFKFIEKARATAGKILEDSKTYLTRVYGRAGDFLTTASPFTQILEVMSEINELLMFYIEDSTVEQNIFTAQQPESIYGLSRLVGHDPTRGFAATGEVRFRWKAGVVENIGGENLIIAKNTKIQFENNGQPYFLRTSKDEFLLPKTFNGWIQASICQGELQSQTVTGTGEPLQSFNIQTNGMTDHTGCKVSINGEQWTKFESMYEMRPTDKGVLIKTGISGGIDIYFGTGNFGVIPPNGSTIEVEYIKCSGAEGNLNQSGDLTFKFVDSAFDSIGNEYDLNEFLDSETLVAPFMGANSESIEFTKMMTPMSSKSFVLSNPDNYEYFLSRYAQFSYLDVYNTTDGYLDDDNVMYIFAIPDLEKRLLKGTDYFSVPIEEFFFGKDETDRFLGVIEDSGQQMVTSEAIFVEPQAVKYRMDISVRWFEGFKQDEIFNDIRSSISNYLLKIVRRDKLPKSDIVALIEAVPGVDAVNVQFVSSVEEEARRNGYYTYKQVTVTPTTPELEGGEGEQKRLVFFKRIEEIKKVVLDQPNMLVPVSGGEQQIKDWYDKIGLDKYGDIILDKEEVAVFRGGWEDRNGDLVKDEPSMGEMASLSLYFDNPPVPQTIYSRIQSGNRRAL